jgi:cytidylate kinase
MTIITISRGTYSKGKEVAEKVAEKLRYECIARRILFKASTEFNIPEVKLTRALHDSPSIFNRFTHGKEKYIAFIRNSFLQHLQKGNTVYHGLAGHFFLQKISHVLKVRITCDMDERVREEMRRENVSENQARHLLAKDDEERRKWSLFLYGIDTWDPNLYDITLHLDKLSVDDLVDIITEVSKRPCFQQTADSQNAYDELLKAAKIQSLLIEKVPTAKVICKNEKTNIYFSGSFAQEDNIRMTIRNLLEEYPEYKSAKLEIVPVGFPD